MDYGWLFEFWKGMLKLVVALAVALSYAQGIGLEQEVVHSIFGVFLQLTIIGFILQFIFSQENSGWIVLTYLFIVCPSLAFSLQTDFYPADRFHTSFPGKQRQASHKTTILRLFYKKRKIRELPVCTCPQPNTTTLLQTMEFHLHSVSILCSSKFWFELNRQTLYSIDFPGRKGKINLLIPLTLCSSLFQVSVASYTAGQRAKNVTNSKYVAGSSILTGTAITLQLIILKCFLSLLGIPSPSVGWELAVRCCHQSGYEETQRWHQGPDELGKVPFTAQPKPWP